MLQTLVSIYQSISLTVYLEDEVIVVWRCLLRQRINFDFIRNDVTVV
jgi:hypothetical protein